MLKIKYNKISFVFIFMGISTMLFADLIGTTYNSQENAFVKDSKTKLEWQNYYDFTSSYQPPLITWSLAIEYCKNLDLNGTKWRLPNIKELRTISDYTRFAPAVFPILSNTIRPGISSDNYWSSTTDRTQNLDPRAWVINNAYGRSYRHRKNTANHVRCVR